MEGKRFLPCIVLASLLAVAGQSLADPGVDLGGPYGGPDTYEWAYITFTATTDDPSLIFWRWDMDNDSVWDTNWRVSMDLSDSIEWSYCDDYHGDIVVDAWDGVKTKIIIIDGEPQHFPDTVNDTARLDVNNHAPFAHLGGPYMGKVGVPIEFISQGRDPGCDDLTFVWDWGDESGEMEYFPYNKDNPEVVDTRVHVYTSPGIYWATLLVLDDDGGLARSTAAVFVDRSPDDPDNLANKTGVQPVPGGASGIIEAQSPHDTDLNGVPPRTWMETDMLPAIRVRAP